MKPISRRTFLGKTARVGATGVLFSAIPGMRITRTHAAEVPTGWQLGCFTRPFDQFDYRVAMDAIAEAGFRYLGLMTTNTKEWIMIRPSTPPEEVQAISLEATSRKLEIVSVHGDFSVAESIEAGIQSLKHLVDACEICRCPSLLLAGTGDEKLYRPYYKVVREGCDYAAARGVGLTIKPHGGQNGTGPQCRKIIELVGQKNFRLWYDPGNIFYYSDGKLDPVEDAATVDGLVVGMSVKDFRPPKEVLVNPGTGKVNFAAVMARLKKGGFARGPLLLECLERGPLETVKASAREARKFLENLTRNL